MGAVNSAVKRRSRVDSMRVGFKEQENSRDVMGLVMRTRNSMDDENAVRGKRGGGGKEIEKDELKEKRGGEVERVKTESMNGSET